MCKRDEKKSCQPKTKEIPLDLMKINVKEMVNMCSFFLGMKHNKGVVPKKDWMSIHLSGLSVVMFPSKLSVYLQFATLKQKNSHYSKSQFFVQKFNFDKNIFTSFSTKIFFWQFFSWNQSCQQLKSTKPRHFHVFFTKKNRQFSREIKGEFLDK